MVNEKGGPMKIFLLTVLISFTSQLLFAQITTPIVKANFGVDADVRANYFNGAASGSGDDWFNGSGGTGLNVIDTNGAAARIAGYLTDVSPWPKRMASFYKAMSKPQYSNVNHRIWMDAIFVRDYHGNDTTVFASGSSKNGMSPANWNCPVAQSIPDKNDILDIFMHIRRNGDGSIPGLTDSLWMFGGVSMDNVTGNRYFDFEMYQTDIYYDRASLHWYGYGPDFGHTSWKFDALGNITQPGDIIFSGEFQSSTLSNIEARIWVKKTDWQTVVPVAFNWSGQFDGASAGATYGYASISPKTAGAFYTGLGSPNNAWAGPFGLVLQDNTLAYTNPAPASTTNSKYVADQFIEFSVNLTKLGLDPVTTFGSDICGTPFNRIVVKTRASASFTAELKDFVAPTDLFLAPRANVLTDIPILCDTIGISHIYVSNPVATSSYTWSTPNGHIVGSSSGTAINVDTSGTYIVTQYLMAGCSAYATDTIDIARFSDCSTLDNNLVYFDGNLENNIAQLHWAVLENQVVKYFEVERSIDGVNFNIINRVDAQFTEQQSNTANYNYADNVNGLATRNVFYRIKLKDISSKIKFSNIIRIPIFSGKKNSLTILPNPVKDVMQLQITSIADCRVDINIYDQSGQLISALHVAVQKGNNVISLNEFADKPRGFYQAIVSVGGEIFSQKILLTR